MAEGATVALGVPLYTFVSGDWFQHVLALKYPNPPVVITSSGALTDKARCEIASRFLSSGAEWLFFLDDDVLPPNDAVLMLLETANRYDAPFVTGVYYKRAAPFDPLIYRQLPDGLYQAVLDMPEQPFYVDACGLGCALIHRGVFERIMAVHKVVLVYGKPFPVPLVKRGPKGPEGVYFNGHHVCIPAEEVDILTEPWPFFLFFGGRTEDLFFAELCREAGIRIVCDPRVQCWHQGLAHFGRPHLEAVLEKHGRAAYDQALGGWKPELVKEKPHG